MLDYLKIRTSNSKLSRYVCCRVLFAVLKTAYIVLVNIRFLGRPSQKNQDFLLSAYKQVFHENLSSYHRHFYAFFGKKLMHIYNYEGTKAGFGLFRINPILTIHMCKFGILEPFQGKGLAKVFLLNSITYWNELGFKKFSVYVDPANFVAKRSYESVGFKVMDCLDTLIYMEKKL